MRLGDFISVEDWDSIVGEPKRVERPSKIERLTIWLIVIGVGIGLGFVQGCDFQAAQATHESVMDAQAKKEQLPPEARVNSYLLSVPMGGTYIEQHGNDAEGKPMKPWRKYVLSADLTGRK